MRRMGPIMVLSVVLVAMLAMPATASAALTNVYGMKYAGQDICLSCHDLSYGDTTHGDFAQVGADPSDDSMWPAGKLGAGELVEKDEIAFTLGAGTGLREYLKINKGGTSSSTPVEFISVEGSGRYNTAIAASQRAFTHADNVIIATGENFPDALGGSALAGAVNGPILLTPSASVPSAVLNEITRLGATKIYILGSSAAVSTTAEDQLKAVAPVERIQGAGRYATALAVANKAISVLGSGFGGKAFMATGANYPDAIAAAPIAFKKGMPIILVDPAGNYTLPAGVTSVEILGSTNVVSAAVETRLQGQLGSGNVHRTAGGSRYETAAKVAAFGVAQGLKWDGVGIATGDNFPDALCGGPLLGSQGSVMLLTPTTSLSSFVYDALVAQRASIYKVYFLGGTPAISMQVRDNVRALLPAHTSAGGDLNPFVVPAMEWDPATPDTWEIGSTGIEMETYTCNPCHHLGATSAGKKPTVGNFASNSVTATINAWVTDANSTASSPEKYVPGSSIQCEVCHGTGTPQGSTPNHFGVFTSNIKILRGTELLKSQMCGQCHGSYKAKNTVGYTPDQNLNLFVTYRGFGDVPTEASFTANPSGYKFFPNGQNKGDKHSYYTEWTLSAHSYRGALNSASAEAQMFQKAGNGHYNATTSSLDCAKCHTGEGYAKRKNLKVMEKITLTNSNVGFLGQECANCHVPHNAGTDNGMGVRQPDAGTTLAGITMTSICEDCHNWQLEMQGLTPTASPMPVKSLTARGGFSHPTREVYNGRGMFEVANADKFMPGVKCEQCHMPATKSDFPDKTGVERYANQSWKRYSHRMFIMEPGKAADWGLAAWGDSCSPCHTGQTQDQLQGFIETWQDEAADAAVEASAAYAGAYAIAEGGAGEGTSTAPFKALMGRAYFNYRNYLGEGSMGAHNPPYIVEGLTKATQMAKSVNGYFDFVASGSAYPGVGYVMGTVKNGDDSPAANAKIVINCDGADHVVYTDANGNFSFVFSGTLPVNVKWQRCSDPVADLTYGIS